MEFLIKVSVLALIIISSGCVMMDYQNEIGNSHADGLNSLEPTTTTAQIHPTTTAKHETNLYFQFIENSTHCRIDGEVFINNISIGKTEGGILRVNFSTFASSGYFGNNNDICITGELMKCAKIPDGWRVERCWLLNITSNYFDVYDSSSIPFFTIVNIHRPQSYYEATNFVRPDDMKNFISYEQDIGFFSNETMADLEKLWMYVDSHVSYRYDSDTSGFDYWKLPAETFKDQWGDCEDWSNLFVSLARAYSKSLKCYSIGLPRHLSSFCKIRDMNTIVYGFFDQNIKIKGFFSSGDEDRKIRQTLDSYFSEFEFDPNEKRIISAFNEEGYFSFKNNDEFIVWAHSL